MKHISKACHHGALLEEGARHLPGASITFPTCGPPSVARAAAHRASTCWMLFMDIKLVRGELGASLGSWLIVQVSANPLWDLVTKQATCSLCASAAQNGKTACHLPISLECSMVKGARSKRALILSDRWHIGTE